MQQASFVPVLVASDEEGGLVQRLTGLLGAMPSAATAAGTSSPDQVRAAWFDYASRAKALGVDVFFGPVIDVGGGPGIGSRSFGDDPSVVAAYGAAVADGLHDAGVMAVFKHFPGHGAASGDSHLGLPRTAPIETLRARDLLPFVDLVGHGARDEAGVMVAHLSVPGLSDDLPTSLSSATITGLLKNELGFDGLVFSDAMNMGAIVDTYGTADAAERAIRAGVDIVILGSITDVVPVLDHLDQQAQADPALAEIIGHRAARVIAAKGQSSICAGAQ